ncbi:MAG: hypothetical protein ACLQO7_08800 [Candidatus Bathyarchaeia archaeon]
MSTSQESSALPNESSSDQQARLARAVRRVELLSYAAAALGITLLAVIIAISLL